MLDTQVNEQAYISLGKTSEITDFGSSQAAFDAIPGEDTECDVGSHS